MWIPSNKKLLRVKKCTTRLLRDCHVAYKKISVCERVGLRTRGRWGWRRVSVLIWCNVGGGIDNCKKKWGSGHFHVNFLLQGQVGTKKLQLVNKWLNGRHVRCRLATECQYSHAFVGLVRTRVKSAFKRPNSFLYKIFLGFKIICRKHF